MKNTFVHMTCPIHFTLLNYHTLPHQRSTPPSGSVDNLLSTSLKRTSPLRASIKV